MIYRFTCDTCRAKVIARVKPGKRRSRCKACATRIKLGRIISHDYQPQGVA